MKCWNKHMESCLKRKKKQPAAKNMSSLFQLGWTAKKTEGAAAAASKPKKDIPKPSTVSCPGITASDDPKVLRYLKRSAEAGGGGKSLVAISMTLFHKAFSRLKSTKNRKIARSSNPNIVTHNIRSWDKWLFDCTYLTRINTREVHN